MLDHETNMPSKSSSMLIQVLGEDNLITEYDNIRKKIKKTGNKQYIPIYKGIIAKLEVKINIKNDALKKELKIIELSNFKQNASLSTLPPEQNQKEYHDLLKQLKYIKAIKNQLKI